jgi:3-hydroxyisobutyrate dehydrogenase-like beta-hydroxyacid dehydrogenase
VSYRIGILYPGGLGAAFGRAIVRAGFTALTCTSGRSENTSKRASEAGFVILSSVQELVSNCDLLLSLVVPAAAMKVAEDLAYAVDAAQHSDPMGHKPIFVDANSVNPCTKERLSAILSSKGIHCIGAAYFGPVNCVGPENILALSGPAASAAALRLKPVLQVQVVGLQIGDASELKMSLAIITKALPALFLEMASAASKRGHLPASLALMKRLYPGIISFIERTLPSYPNRLERRLQELDEVIDWLTLQGQQNTMTRSARGIFHRLRAGNLEREQDWPLEELLSEIANLELLAET